MGILSSEHGSIVKPVSSKNCNPINNFSLFVVCSKIDGVLQNGHHSHCLGPLLLIHNDTAPLKMSALKLDVLQGMDEGAKKLKTEFEKVGFAVIWLQNPSSAEVTAAVDYLSSEEAIKKFPKSYEFFGVYVTCHGLYHKFLTRDGCLPYSMVANIAKSHHLTNLKLFLFIFDCCRSDSDADTVLFPDSPRGVDPETNMGSNTMIIYAQTGTQTAWGPGDGITFMAHELIKLINTDISLTSLPAKLRQGLKKIPLLLSMKVPSHETLLEDVFLVRKRNDKSKFL